MHSNQFVVPYLIHNVNPKKQTNLTGCETYLFCLYYFRVFGLNEVSSSSEILCIVLIKLIPMKSVFSEPTVFATFVKNTKMFCAFKLHHKEESPSAGSRTRRTTRDITSPSITCWERGERTSSCHVLDDGEVPTPVLSRMGEEGHPGLSQMAEGTQPCPVLNGG